MKLDGLEKVFVQQLKDMYSAENQLLEALPKMAQAATSSKLEQAFRDHLKETQGQVKRLEKIFSSIDYKPGGHRCRAMEGLIEEGKEIIDEQGEPEARDAALICAAQKVEHYEMATYGTLRTYARTLGLDDACELLTETLREERNADSLLTDLAEHSINKLAMLTAS
ncbi:MAG: ferritin-like domain-containing protein [Phycisphaerales bacterium]|nr:ferritin-like domain-containing protein [Phycisphaerales bacterium]